MADASQAAWLMLKLYELRTEATAVRNHPFDERANRSDESLPLCLD